MNGGTIMHARILLLGGLLMFVLPATSSAQQSLIADGARVYGQNCTRCHNVRPPAERSDGEWKLIVMHMRARANLTRTQADAVAAYLTELNVILAPPAMEPQAATPTGSGGSTGSTGGPPPG